MKASTRYNDFVGTSAADINDHASLTEFLRERGLDTNRYYAIGASFCSEQGVFSVFILCVDKRRSTVDQPHVLQVLLDDNITHETFFGLFQKIEVEFSVKATCFTDHYRNASPKEVRLEELLVRK